MFKPPAQAYKEETSECGGTEYYKRAKSLDKLFNIY